MVIFTNRGLRDIARHTLGIDLHLSMLACLWTNNVTPDVTDTLASYVVCTLPGYTNINLAPNSWRENSLSGFAEYVYPTWTTNFSAYGGDQVTIYGYFIKNIISNNLLWVEQFLMPYNVPNSGGKIPVTISFKLSNCVC